MIMYSHTWTSLYPNLSHALGDDDGFLDPTDCQKPFSLEGADLKVDSRCKVILDLLKWASTRKYKIGLQNATPFN